MTRAEAIEASLELVAERHGDPASAVYERLFAANPEMEALFVRDVAGTVRGEMLAVALKTLMDLVDEGLYARTMVMAELVNHDGLGVPPAVFGTFFATVRDVFRDLSGPDWTPAMDTAWTETLAELDGLVARQTEASGL